MPGLLPILIHTSMLVGIFYLCLNVNYATKNVPKRLLATHPFGYNLKIIHDYIKCAIIWACTYFVFVDDFKNKVPTDIYLFPYISQKENFCCKGVCRMERLLSR